MKEKMAKLVRIAYHLGAYTYHTFMMYLYLAAFKISILKKRLKEALDIWTHPTI